MALPNSRATSNVGRGTQFESALARLTICIAAVFAITAALYLVPLHERAVTAAFAFLPCVLIVAAVWGLRYAVLTSVLTALAFSWLVPPVGFFWAKSPRDIARMLASLVIGVVAGHLSDRARRETLNARRSEKELRDVIDTIPAIVWAALPDGSNEFVNSRWTEYTGQSAEQAAGSGWQRVILPEDLERHMEKWGASLATDQPFESEVRVRRVDGEYRWFFVRGIPLRDETGNILRWYGTMTEIEDRKCVEQALRQSEAYLAEAQSLTHTGTWAWDPKTDRVLYCSEELCRIFGVDPREGFLSREHFWERLLPEDYKRTEETVIKAIREKTDYAEDYRIVLPDGTVRYIQTIAHPVLDTKGEVLEYVGTAMDVTERKRAEEERERLRQLEADLAQMNRVSLMGELAASLTHEIKQPIAAVAMNAKACLRWLQREPPEIGEACEAVSRVIKDVVRADDIIDRNRSLYRRDTPQREPVSLNDIIREMIVLLQYEANRHAVAIHTDLVESLPKVLADRIQMQQVLMNLMLNGIQAMKDAGGELHIQSRPADDGRLLISVSDTGIGLPAEHADRIFDAFVTTKPTGTGMGLSISRTIIESHGGRLWASGNNGRGTTFHFTLPIGMRESSPSAA